MRVIDLKKDIKNCSCGSKDLIVFFGTIRCSNCGLLVGGFNSFGALVNRWNKIASTRKGE